MSPIYKRYRGNKQEVLVTSGVIAEGSVKHALKGRQYMRGLRGSRLMYEAFISQLVQRSLVFDLADDTKEKLELVRGISQSEESCADAV